MSLLDTASLIVTPSAYKEGKLYSVIPSDGSGDLSVVRATTATRVNSAGLVELVPYNLLQYSEQFDNAVWTKSAVTVTANNAVSPSNVQDADLITANGATTQHYLLQTVSASAKTYSVFAKMGTQRYIQILTSGTAAPVANFDLQDGVANMVGSNSTASIEDYGNGWYRCILQTNDILAANFYINYASSLTMGRFGATTSSGTLYLWGAQANEGTILPYQKTETRLNIPRLDYSNGTCPSLLVEPQRTNLLQRSQEFDNAYWQELNGGVGSIPTVTANTATAPDGTLTADRIQLSLNGGTLFSNISYINANVSTTAATFSIYAKSNTTPCTIYFRNGSTVTTINITTEWQRFNLYSSGAITLVQFGLRGGSYGGAVNSNTADISVWGAQIEVGTYPTSYIPTTSASVTRNADNIELLNSAILPTAYPFTMFVDAKYSSLLAFFPLSFLNTAANDNYFAIRFQSGKVDALIRPSTTEIALISSSTFTEGQAVRVAVKVESGTIKLFVNGQLQASATNTVLFNAAINDLFIGRLRSSFDTNTRLGLNAAAIWDTALTDTECQTLTTV